MSPMQKKINLLYENPRVFDGDFGSLLKMQIEILQELVETGQKSKLSAIIPLLDNDSPLTPHVLETISSLLQLFDASDLLDLDLRIRKSPYAYSWREMEPHSMPGPGQNKDRDETILLIGIYSMHPNGYVREKALKALAEFEPYRILPYVILRLNDPVEQLRTLAESFLESSLKGDIGAQLMQWLPIIGHIKKWYRGHRRDLFDGIDTMIRSRISPETLTPLISKGSRGLRRSLADLLPAEPGYEDLTLKLLQDNDPLVRNMAFIKATRGPKIPPELLQRLITARFPEQRRDGLLLLAKLNTDEARDKLVHGLLDKSPRVRSVAQYYLARNFQWDPLAYYRSRFPEPLALLGLGEMNAQADRTRIESIAREGKGRSQVVAALEALAKMDANAYRDLFLTRAQSSDPILARKSVRLLSHCERYDGDALLLLHREQGEDVRRLIIKMAQRLSRWNALAILLQIHAQENSQSLRQLCVRLISGFPQKRPTFMKASKLDSKVIQSLLPFLDELSMEIRSKILLDMKALEG